MSLNSEVRCWTQVAARNGGALQVRYIFIGPRQFRTRFGIPSLHAQISGVSVYGEVTSEGYPPATFAQLTARAPSCTGLKLRIYRTNAVPQIGRSTAMHDLRTESPQFDQVFTLRSNDPGYAQIWLGSSTRQAMLAAPDYSFEIDEGRVSASSARADDHTQLEAAFTALSHLSNRGRELSEQIKNLATKLGARELRGDRSWLGSSDPILQFTSSGRRVSLSIVRGKTAHRGERRLLSRLWCRRLATRSDRFVFYADHLPRKERPMLATKLARCDLGVQHLPGFIVHASNRERLAQRLGEKWGRSILRLSPLMFRCSGGSVELMWAGAFLGEQELREAAELCEYFAVERRGVVARGPYR